MGDSVRKWLLIPLIILCFIPISKGLTVKSIDYNIKLNEIGGRKYTPTCLSNCHLVFNITLNNNIIVQNHEFTNIIKTQIGDFEIRDWGFDYLVNESYIKTISNWSKKRKVRKSRRLDY